MRIVFLGTGEIGLPTLRVLLEHPKHRVVGVVTQPDKPVGRKQIVTPPEVKVIAMEHGIPVAQPKRIRKPEALREIEAMEAEVMVVMAYGQILPRALLDMPPVACLNLHASLLPRHRGAAPIQAAIRDGDERSGITVMHVAEGLDTGDILLQHDFELRPDETGGSLHDRLAACAPGALAEALDLLEAGRAPRVVQEEARATYTGKLTREDGVIDWNQPAECLERLIRAYDPWPGTLTHLPHGDGTSRRLKIFPPVEVVPTDVPLGPPGSVHAQESGSWLIATAGDDDALGVSQVQVEGKRRMSVAQFCQGNEVPPGTRLT